MNWQAWFEPGLSERLCLALGHSLWVVALAAAAARGVQRVWSRWP
jgi:hypothetical protein